MAPISIVSIHPTINWVNTGKWIGCHTPLISDYSSKQRLTREWVWRCAWTVPYISAFLYTHNKFNCIDNKHPYVASRRMPNQPWRNRMWMETQHCSWVILWGMQPRSSFQSFNMQNKDQLPHFNWKQCFRNIIINTSLQWSIFEMARFHCILYHLSITARHNFKHEIDDFTTLTWSGSDLNITLYLSASNQNNRFLYNNGRLFWGP